MQNNIVNIYFILFSVSVSKFEDWDGEILQIKLTLRVILKYDSVVKYLKEINILIIVYIIK